MAAPVLSAHVPPAEALTTTFAKASGFLERFREQPLGHWINGRADRGTSKELFENLSPVDGRELGQVVAADAQDVDAAVCAAEKAFPAWRAMLGGERRAILHRVAD